MNSLSWQFARVNGRIENTVMQSSFQPLGNTGNNLRLAQSLLVKIALNLIDIRLIAKAGGRLISFVSIQADSAGKP